MDAEDLYHRIMAIVLTIALIVITIYVIKGIEHFKGINVLFFLFSYIGLIVSLVKHIDEIF